ncbi:Glutamate carboxypeptidase, partial [Globisporangium splendens]
MIASSKKKAPQHAALSQSAASDAYGTFHGHDASDAPVRVPQRHETGFAGHATTLRTISVVGFLLFAMSYVLTAQDPVTRPHALPTMTDSAVTTNNNKVEAIVEETVSLDADVNTIEKKFLSGVDRKKIQEYLHAYAAVPHPAGSKEDYNTAVWTAKQFEAFGLNATIKEYYPLLSLPVRRHLAIVAPESAARELNLTEASVSGDSCTTNDKALPPFLAYSASGNVTTSVVYVNFGTPADFQWLVENNVTLKGKIALVRYGGNFRGLKVMVSEQHGMAGVLIYSDPHDDGFTQGATYPDGPWRPEGSFQRGSIQYNSLAGGDPLTPGFPSNLGAPYLDYETAYTIPHIPALPLSYGQAKYILQSLGGKKAPDAWQGAVTFADGYHVGDDEATVLNLDLVMDNKIGPIWDVIGTIDGAVEPDQHVLIGNHRDAWVCGAVDPSSGSAAMLELARNLGELLKGGWRPRRKLVLASWDGEEYGLLGSTEWAEDHAALLKKHAVAYINVDNVVGPYVMASGTPSIAGFLKDTAKAVPANKYFANETATSLYEQWTNQTASRRSLVSAHGGNDGTLGPDHMIGFMGSGTDFTAFYQHLGVISANLGYVIGTGMYGVYHSTMDSLRYMETVGDPEYRTHETTTKWWGLLTLRLADNAIVPFDFSTYGLVMDEDLTGFEAQVAALHQDAVDFSKLRDAIKELSANAELFQARISDFAEKSKNVVGDEETDKTRREWNEKLVKMERYLLSGDGLPHRPWFKHVIFGPGFYEGYGGTAFPGISDSIAFKDNATTIQAHVDDVASIVSRAAQFLVATS